ncbi:hypothetical protein [Sedimentitalea todarodis]|uniref:DUF4190 domain-containing protein n=1 Tax=Sedimentitalea todarodis TaxID=1631240 RepID=A0ABU3VKW2_9RHOB|nr:hypothetical protein [Sedimentitalea todarodis]MDU9006831.1 hypothetical protein [Sedimentitalea todarodis]
MNDTKVSISRTFANLSAGGGFGLLLGVIVGLSQTPVVMGVITVLTGLLAVFLGIKAGGDSSEIEPQKLQSNHARIGSFGLAAAIGLILGIYLRIANPFSEDPMVESERWTRAFPDNPVLASQAMLYERLGVEPSVWYFDPDAAVEATVNVDQAKARRGGLFGVLQRSNLCRDLDPAQYSNDPEILLTAYDIPSEPVLVSIAAQVRDLPPSQQLSALTIVHTTFCELNAEQEREAQK